MQPHRSNRSELLVSDPGTMAFIPWHVIPFSVKYNLGFHKIEFPQSPEKDPTVDQGAHLQCARATLGAARWQCSWEEVGTLGQGSRPHSPPSSHQTKTLIVQQSLRS